MPKIASCWIQKHVQDVCWHPGAPHTWAEWCSNMHTREPHAASCAVTIRVRRPQVMSYWQDTHLNTFFCSTPSCLQ